MPIISSRDSSVPNPAAALSIKQLLKSLAPKQWVLKRAFRLELIAGEPELKIIPAISRRDEMCIDVGANLGVYSYLFSKWSDRVLAVEGHPGLATRLEDLLPASVCVMNIAASDGDGFAQFYIPSVNGTEINSRCSLEAGANLGMDTRSIRVPTRRLDSLPLGPGGVGVIKVDVEGHELNALRGMTGILERFQPTLIVESESRHCAEAPGNVFEFLAGFSYQGYFVHRDRLRPLASFSVAEFQNDAGAKPVFGARSPDYVNNFIFIHSSRLNLLDGIVRIFPFRSFGT